MIRYDPPKSPCELPRESLFAKSYRAAVLGDGSVLPIEERLGRRLLRVIAPESAEGRRLLRGGRVVLLGEAEEWAAPIDEVLDDLERQARQDLDEDDEDGRRQLAATLDALERHRRDYDR